MDSSTPPPPYPPQDLSGRVLEDFRVLRRLGQGGMGQVYLAEQLSLQRQVALKILRSDLAADATALKRFQSEAAAVARVNHANIVQVFATGTAEGLHYIALEYIQGRNLSEYLTRKGPPDVPLALSIMTQVAAALQRASELGIIHRDIKPENILLTRRGEVKVADFGLSRVLAGDFQAVNLTQTGLTMGTPLYMSPEQVEGKQLDPRTDIYSFGVTCYHMLAGEPPFRGDHAFEVALKHVRSEPTALQDQRPDLPPELCALVHKMMAKEPAQRYQTCRDLLKDLARLRQQVTQALIRPDDKALAAPLLANEPDAEAAYLALEDEEAPVLVPANPAIANARPQRRWVLALGLVAAASIGSALGLVRAYQFRPTVVDEETAVTASSPVEALFSDKKREQFLLMAVEQYADPGNSQRLEVGLVHRLELGLFYLKAEPPRLQDADQYFLELMRNPQQVKAYTTLGRVGHAIVLALQDRASESNALFLEVFQEILPEKDPIEQGRFLLNNPELRYWIARALDYNAVNLEAARQPFPEKLRALRQPPFPVPGAPLRDKGKAKA